MADRAVSDEGGRVVPLSRASKGHHASARSTLELATEYAHLVRFHLLVVDNSDFLNPTVAVTSGSPNTSIIQLMNSSESAKLPFVNTSKTTEPTPATRRRSRTILPRQQLAGEVQLVEELTLKSLREAAMTTPTHRKREACTSTSRGADDASVCCIARISWA